MKACFIMAIAFTKGKKQGPVCKTCQVQDLILKVQDPDDGPYRSA